MMFMYVYMYLYLYFSGLNGFFQVTQETLDDAACGRVCLSRGRTACNAIEYDRYCMFVFVFLFVVVLDYANEGKDVDDGDEWTLPMPLVSIYSRFCNINS